MSRLVHEEVLQDYIIENLSSLKLSIENKLVHRSLIEFRKNSSGTFWDLDGKLDNGEWIPVEVEWVSENFLTHGHYKSPDFPKFQKKGGVILVLRKTRNIGDLQQVSILENQSESEFKRLFNIWYKQKAIEYSNATIEEYFIGNYKRSIPRVLLYPISGNARDNYFCQSPLYKKHPKDPNMAGFKKAGFDYNKFVQDIQTNDIILFIDAYGKRTNFKVFKKNLETGNIPLYRATAFRIRSKLYERDIPKHKVDHIYWPDEIKQGELIYPYRCLLADEPFWDIRDKTLPYIPDFGDKKWEYWRRCIQWGKL